MNQLIIGADNLQTIDKLMVPNSNPPNYVNTATITWQLLDQNKNVLGSGSWSYIGGSNGQYQTIIPASLTSILINNAEYTLNSSVTATGFVSLFTDNFIALAPQSAQFSYCVRSDLENIFGATNIAKWADINNDGDVQTIDARINWAMMVTYHYMNSKLEGCIYRIPFSGQYPIITYCNAGLAAVKLYESRGITNYNEASGKPEHQLENIRTECNNFIGQIRAGILRINGTLPQDLVGTNVPMALNSRSRRFLYGR